MSVEKKAGEKMAVKKGRGKKGRWKKWQWIKWPMENGRRKKKRKNNHFKTYFSATANIFVRNFFFSNTPFNLRTSFIRII